MKKRGKVSESKNSSSQSTKSTNFITRSDDIILFLLFALGVYIILNLSFQQGSESPNLLKMILSMIFAIAFMIFIFRMLRIFKNQNKKIWNGILVFFASVWLFMILLGFSKALVGTLALIGGIIISFSLLSAMLLSLWTYAHNKIAKK